MADCPQTGIVKKFPHFAAGLRHALVASHD